MTEQVTSTWKHVQTFEIVIRHNSEKPIMAIDVAIAINKLDVIDCSKANFNVKECARV